MIGFSVFLCKEKIAIIKRKREKGHVNLSRSTFEGKKKTENGTKRLIFTAVSIMLEIVFLLFLFTKVSEYATIIDWATRIVAIFLVLGLYIMDKCLDWIHVRRFHGRDQSEDNTDQCGEQHCDHNRNSADCYRNC